MSHTMSTGPGTDAARIAREQAEVAAVLGRARQGRVDEAAVLADDPTGPAPSSGEEDEPVPGTGRQPAEEHPPAARPAEERRSTPRPAEEHPPAPRPTEEHLAAPRWPAPTGSPVAPARSAPDAASHTAAPGAAQHRPDPYAPPTAWRAPSSPTNDADRWPWAVTGSSGGQGPAPVPGGGSGGPSEPTAEAAQPGGGGRRGRRPGWAALTGTAAAAALLASMGTAALTGAFDDPPPSAAVEQTQTAQTVPVSATAQQPDWQAVSAAVRESVVAIAVQTASGDGAGSGVVLDAEGHVLTNSHVVDGARGGSVVVTLSDGRMYEAQIVGQDETTDLAVLALVDPPDDLVPATFGSSADLVVGEPVAAVGNPLGLDSTVTTGIVSALDRPVVTQSESASVVTSAIQVDAAINPGNSGGPLFDAQGEVIGITSSIATLSGGSSSGSIGLGFAIPIDQASDVAAQLVADGTVEHAFLGVGLADATATADGVTRQGAEVRQVEQGSPADTAGLRAGDVVTAVDDRSVDGAASLTGYVRQHGAGDEVVLTVVRDGTATQVPVTLAVREQLLR